MHVGVNYPWFDCGWDFGDAPSGWRGQEPRWSNEIDPFMRQSTHPPIRLLAFRFARSNADTVGFGGAAGATSRTGVAG